MDLILSLLVTSVIGVLSNLFYEALRKITGRYKTEPKATTSAEKLQILIDNLSQTSKDADNLTQEIVADLKKRELALAELQAKNTQLAAEEEELKKRIAALKDVPIEVAEYFQKINQQNMEKADKRSGRRDVVFFVLGALVSVVVQLVIR